MADCDPILHLIPLHSYGAEIGVARGVSSEAFLLKPCRMLLVDPWAPTPGYEETLGSGDAFEEAMKRLDGYGGWTALRMTSAEAAEKFIHPVGFDFVFIDGNHKYEYVLQDCRLWWEHIRPGGVLCGHDFNLPCHEYGVQKAVKKFSWEARNADVIEVHLADETGGLDCWSIKKPCK